VAEFLEPILAQLDRSRFHITLYPTSTRLEPRADRFRKLADEYKSLVRTPDKMASDLIRADRIDILIDTTGHMACGRLGIFARRAAPVQCHYIGYHGTTGLTEMDWFIADETLLPSCFDSHFREKIWRLPRLRLSYMGDAALPVSNWKPDPDGIIWLGSFNNLTKVREEALSLWAKVMNAIPNSRLLLKDRKAIDHAVQQRIRTELAHYGISGERVEFVGYVSEWSSHMALYDRLDIALDTIPLNSETTAFDALWMGVPLVALEGNWYGGRMASTILKAFGKTEWVAQDEDEYVTIVSALAQSVERRKLLRTAQRDLMASSPLCDVLELTRAIEDAFEKMFDRWIDKCRSSRS
jgi:protein O-GlcNAc transferase